ncbi:DUF1640 domain-containing protein [Rhodoplanes elegans]|uniref:DUF1640 domain-containing protein n=1 Tax=Rhodoplanes elegans TaxID=29408 RepID=A0A327KIJ1_9BRAD|nr:DUF1640 domain-containing protein [Rhodoplanes elegans]MBK5960996.1 DUF1640 domain-containing protein [Rhodoplanes elegans]RAI38619.1 DUF1640 domain-containing protein [Rhodoplanes elegans]
MTIATFDSLKFARALREKAKMSAEQAEGFADAISEAIQSDLASKADVTAVRTEIKDTEQRLDARIKEAELRLEASIAASKAEILKWMFGTIGFQTLIILGAVLALSRGLKP